MAMTARLARYNRRMERELPVELRLVANQAAGANLADVSPSAAPSRLGAAAVCCMIAGAGIWGGVAYALFF